MSSSLGGQAPCEQRGIHHKYPLSLDGRGLGRGCKQLPHKNIHFAKALRTNQTDAELKVWQALRAGRLMGYKFKRQVPVGDFIVDFVCFEQKLIVELDGGQHMGSERDVIRDARLNTMGFRVLRFWNNEVMQNIEGVLVVILQYLQIVAPSPQPSPTRGEGV